MASLYTTAGTLRKGLLVALLVAIGITGFDVLTRVAQNLQSQFVQTPSFYEQPVSTISAAVPKELIKIPSLEIASDSNPAFVIDGAFPSMPDTLRLYALERPRQKLDTVDRARATANKLGFPGTPNDLSSELIGWSNARDTKALRFNKVSQVWEMRTQYFLDTQALQPKTLLETEVAYEAKMSSLVNTLGFVNQSIVDGTFTAKYSLLGNDALFTNPVNRTQANYVTISGYRKLPLARVLPPGARSPLLEGKPVPPDLNGKVYSIDPRYGSLKMVASDGLLNANTDIYALDFIDYEYNLNNYTVEFSVNPQQAWSRVQDGDGALTLLKLQGSDYFAASQKLNVSRFIATANQTELAYWEPATFTGYVYPIYVFRGRAELADGKLADFVFYVDAMRRVEDITK